MQYRLRHGVAVPEDDGTVTQYWAGQLLDAGHKMVQLNPQYFDEVRDDDVTDEDREKSEVTRPSSRQPDEKKSDEETHPELAQHPQGERKAPVQPRGKRAASAAKPKTEK
jgi:hypothetical protein